MQFKKMFKVVFVDFMALLVGIINGFLLPKFLDIESYAYIKTFLLYVGYSGVFHFGFSDGMYILLGGKNINDVKKEKIKGYLITLIKIIIIVSIILIFINIFMIKKLIFTFFIIYTIPFQITLFASLLYRATGEFDKYIIIRSTINLFSLISTLVTIFILPNPIIYILIQTMGYIFIAFVYLISIFSQKIKSEKIQINEIKLLINTGFIIMIANTVNNLFLSLDRLVIKVKFSVTDFAYYSFGVSMLSLFTTLISSVTVIFYPYLAKSNGDRKMVENIKNYIIIICSFAPTGYFILELIVKIFIDKYINSLDILGILILTIPFMTVINVVYSNLYKVENRGKEYLIVAIKILIVALSLNILTIFLKGTCINIAYATLLSLIIWYVYSSRHFLGLKIKYKEVVYLFIYIISYIIIREININPLLKAIIFSFIIFINILTFYNSDVKELIKLIIKKE